MTSMRIPANLLGRPLACRVVEFGAPTWYQNDVPSHLASHGTVQEEHVPSEGQTAQAHRPDGAAENGSGGA